MFTIKILLQKNGCNVNKELKQEKQPNENFFNQLNVSW